MPQVLELMRQMGHQPPTHMVLNGMVNAAPAAAERRKEAEMDEALHKMGDHVKTAGPEVKRSRTGSVIRGVQVRRTGKVLFDGGEFSRKEVTKNG